MTEHEEQQRPAPISIEGDCLKQLKNATRAIGTATIALAEARLALALVNATPRQKARRRDLSAMIDDLHAIRRRVHTIEGES